MSERIIVGCMTGTSIDAIDVALLRVSGRGLALRAEFLQHASRPLGALAESLRAIAGQQPVTAGFIAEASDALADAHVAAVADLLRAAGRLHAPDLVSLHGQTVFHQPPSTWQLISAGRVAAGVGADVVFDLRAADVAAGGQGAPITPLADYLLFASPQEPRTIVNLGGFCNITELPRRSSDAVRDAREISGGDVCACNHLLDQIARTMLNAPFDRDGAAALAGRARPADVAALADLLARQARSGRSLGTGDEAGEWIARLAGSASASDVARAACEAIGMVIARRVSTGARVILAGGGARNLALRRALAEACAAPHSLSDEFGIPLEAREAACMAVLGALCEDGVPITLPQVTGVRAPAPLAGAWACVRHRPARGHPS